MEVSQFHRVFLLLNLGFFTNLAGNNIPPTPSNDKLTTYSYRLITTVGTAQSVHNSTPGRASSAPVAVVVSNNNAVHLESYNYTITPSQLDAKFGDSYALTCRTDTSNGFDQLNWMIKTGFENHQSLNCDGRLEEEVHFMCEVREFPNGLLSVLNITTFKDAASHSLVNYTFYCNAHGDNLPLANQQQQQQQKQQQQQQQGVAVVTVYPEDHTLETGLEVAGGTLLVLVVLVAAFLVFRKGQLRSAFAGMRDV